MKIAGSIIAVFFCVFGNVIMILNILPGLIAEGAILSAVLLIPITMIQTILSFVSFFKAEGPGIGLMVTGGLVLLIGLISGANGAIISELFIILGGYLLWIGSRKEQNRKKLHLFKINKKRKKKPLKKKQSIIRNFSIKKAFPLFWKSAIFVLGASIIFFISSKGFSSEETRKCLSHPKKCTNITESEIYKYFNNIFNGY